MRRGKRAPKGWCAAGRRRAPSKGGLAACRLPASLTAGRAATTLRRGGGFAAHASGRLPKRPTPATTAPKAGAATPRPLATAATCGRAPAQSRRRRARPPVPEPVCTAGCAAAISGRSATTAGLPRLLGAAVCAALGGSRLAGFGFAPTARRPALPTERTASATRRRPADAGFCLLARPTTGIWLGKQAVGR